MERPWAAILLAGAIERSELARELDMPPLCLPMRHDGTLLASWVERLQPFPRCTTVRVVMNSTAEAEQVRATLSRELAVLDHLMIDTDPAPWRGTAGLVHDMATELDDDHFVVVIEANCLPPASLKPLFDSMQDELDGVVGITAANEPAGVYLMRKRLLDQIRDVGFVDLKEQFIPQAYDHGARMRAVPIADDLLRIRSRRTYLESVRRSETREHEAVESTGGNGRKDRPRGRGRVYGICRIDASAEIADDAVVYDSIVLDGAVIEPGAVVCRCIVGSHARVPAGSRQSEAIVTEPPSLKRMRLAQRRREHRQSDSSPAPVRVVT